MNSNSKPDRYFVYVSGPLTAEGKYFQNIGNALDAATELLQAGLAPYVPHLNYFWEAQAGSAVNWENNYRVWIDMDFAWIDKCDALLRLPGASGGGDREVAYAQRNGIPVFYNVQDVISHFKFVEMTNELDNEKEDENE